MRNTTAVSCLAIAAMALTLACGKKAPTQPSQTSQQNTPTGQSVVGSVTIPGGAGIVAINATTRVGTVGANPLDRLIDLIEPRLFAQGGTADGALFLPDGTTVSLSETVSGSVQLVVTLRKQDGSC